MPLSLISEDLGTTEIILLLLILRLCNDVDWQVSLVEIVDWQVKELDETANRLMQSYPDQAQTTYNHQKEINESWNALTSMVGANLSQRLIS